MKLIDKIVLILICLSVFFFILFTNAYAVTLTITQPAIRADGYRIYYGEQLDKLIYSTDFGNLTTFEIKNLECGKKFFFECRAYNITGETIGSNVVEYTTPVCPTLPAIPEGWAVEVLIIKPK